MNPTFKLPIQIKAVVDLVIDDKGQYTGYALMRKSHSEIQWKYAYETLEKIITEELLML